MSGNSVSMHHILSVTNNWSFSKERELVLTTLGFRVQSRDRWTIRHAPLDGFDLIILCHTVSTAEASRVADRLKRCGSAAPVLKLLPHASNLAQSRVDGGDVPAWALAAQFLVRWRPAEIAQQTSFGPPVLRSRIPVSKRSIQKPILAYSHGTHVRSERQA